jgi:Zn-finger nucleic acid-binding protein
MKCPVCKEPELIMSERQGIEIDYCPGCRGIWLDRGELDKIVEKSVEPAAARPSSGDAQRIRSDPHENHHYHDDHHKNDHPKHWKRRSWLGELFD